MAFPQSIQTQRLVLRRFREQDAADLFDYLHAPTASCFLSLALADVEAARAEARKRSADNEHMAVCLGESGHLIGDLFAVQEDDTFSVGWNFNPRFGGAGYAHEAAMALFAHLFTDGAARRLYAYVEDHNGASRRLCEKLGMRAEGLFLEFISFRNDAQGAPVYENTMQYAILRKEWLRASSA
ncbi:RimJ/RimL family protein N-acetyltransferase [Variovorax boronicumulans]|uniref:RimJ/RimL family protein N-acetyltransferase n=1 Tax=Variovorax boronicumulans TaxID=436515 RepID=A0AAW8D4K3_9BURK|nr:GNAT family protein [Variovorax boronicumulans]MDP9894927.1 RimJ/RimL family protein N-acetyltransferase [Variovorax boronicumulans]MDQ0054753.1 RimJ/RimL family protein N-acetyltransferase [Variovorax boronicumulans]